LIDDGYWEEALFALERSADYADVSSDICYLLALARSHENKPRGTVLDALNFALAVNRWNMFRPEPARLFKAEHLIAIRAYSDALHELSMAGRGPEEAVLTLKALSASGSLAFRRYMKEALDRYPRETGPVRIFFDYLKADAASGRNPVREDLELLELVTRRLQILLLDDPELAWIAAPHLRDQADARRMVASYRAVNRPVPASLPAALKLGIITEEAAVEELFAGAQTLDLTVLEETWNLLRKEEARNYFRRMLSGYSGVILEDADMDGIYEASAEYHGGLLEEYTYDATQDNVPDLTIFFEAGVPLRALALIPPESLHSRKEALIKWERYPAVLEVEYDGAIFVPRPLDFYFSPVDFTELWGSGVLFPRQDPLCPPMTRRVMVFQSLIVERPSLEFPGGVEVIELAAGIPIRAREYIGDLMVSETDFLRGRPQLQWVDLDLDGFKETVRHFRRNYRQMELEDLWNYDRDFDYIMDNEY
jgi:hypothetical protein